MGGQLADFDKVHVQSSGGYARASLAISATSLAFYDKACDRRMAKRGAWRLMIMDNGKVVESGAFNVI